MTTFKGETVGLVRPPHVFFFEIDTRQKNKLRQYAEKYLRFFSLYKTKHGYHLIGYPFRKRIWRIFKRAFKTDYTAKLKRRWGLKGNFARQVLRIEPKFEFQTGKIYSERPKKVLGNFEMINVDRFKKVFKCK